MAGRQTALKLELLYVAAYGKRVVTVGAYIQLGLTTVNTEQGHSRALLSVAEVVIEPVKPWFEMKGS